MFSFNCFPELHSWVLIHVGKFGRVLILKICHQKLFNQKVVRVLPSGIMNLSRVSFLPSNKQVWPWLLKWV